MLAALVNALRRNPYPVYAAMRRVAPVVHLRRPGLWMLFDYESVRRALHDPDSFSSRAGPPGSAPLDWLIFLDPPRHTSLRTTIARAFTPRAVAALEPRITAYTNELLDAVIDRGQMDLVADLAEPLPVLVIVEMMGLPPADAPRVKRWSEAILRLGDTILGGEVAARARRTYLEARGEMQPYVATLVHARRAAPRDDLLTQLLEADADGERLTDDEIFSFFQLLLLAGTETTTGLITNAVLCFLGHPGELARLRAVPALLPAAIEEVLRFQSPVQMVFRTTVRDVALRDRVIPAGELVLAMIGSANRDGRRFPHAHRFDIGRAPVPHVGFGHGIHFCLGAALARLEARVALSVLLSRVADLQRIDGRPWPPRTALNVHGPQAFPIQFTPATPEVSPRRGP
jgi:Cytochrome P450